MYDACLFCGTAFRRNRVLAQLRLGRSFAYDPNRSRLWILCRRCQRWCLVPLEARWETLHELERLHQSTRTSAASDGMARFRHRGVQVLRLGVSSRRDEAWLRYGRAFRIRRFLHGPAAVGLVGGGVTLFAAAAGRWDAIGVLGGYGLAVLIPVLAEFPRVASHGFIAWRGSATCAKCGTPRSKLRYSEFRRVDLRLGREGGMALRMPCHACDRRTLRLDGAEAENLLLRGLVQRHFFGASRRSLDAAVGMIEDTGSAYSFLRGMAQRQERIRDFSPEETLALEIAAAERAESRVAAEQLEAHRATWNEEEELASIIDDELTPQPKPTPLRHPGA
jgi:hypothetical protein